MSITSTKSCNIEQCARPHFATLYCKKHYLQIWRKGYIYKSTRDKRPAIIEGGIAKIPLGLEAKDGYALVDKEFAYLSRYNWSANMAKDKRHVYAQAKINGRHTFLHRLIAGTQDGLVTDHINHDTLDNRKENLRECTWEENRSNYVLVGATS